MAINSLCLCLDGIVFISSSVWKGTFSGNRILGQPFLPHHFKDVISLSSWTLMRNQLTPYNKTKSPKEFSLLLWQTLKFLFVLAFEYYDLDILKYSLFCIFFYSVYIKLLGYTIFFFYPKRWEISLKTCPASFLYWTPIICVLEPLCNFTQVPEALYHVAH